ncbi:hypothetical protein MW887_008626 [Aspergillus wentii]|nr:hypothetical protein MW887_008626 [Aspergillus wentii]
MPTLPPEADQRTHFDRAHAGPGNQVCCICCIGESGALFWRLVELSCERGLAAERPQQLVQWIDLQSHDNCNDQEKDQRQQGQAVFSPEATGKGQPKGYLATAK